MNLPKPHLPNYTHCGTAYVSRSFWACWFINGTRSLALDGFFWLWWKILESQWLSPTKSHETLDSIIYSESWDPDPIISLGQGKTAFHVPQKEIGGRTTSSGVEEYKMVPKENPVSADYVRLGSPGWAILVAQNNKTKACCGPSHKSPLT